MYQEECSLIDNENGLRNLNYQYKMKHIKMEINLKALQKKIVSIQIELLKFILLKLDDDLNNKECSISNEILSYLDSYFEPDYTRKIKCNFLKIV